MRRTAHGILVYCITEEKALPPAPGMHPTRDVYLITHRDLAAVASEAPWDDFGALALRRHLQDASWLEQEARAHERVVEQIMADRPVLPMKLCTVFRSERRVRAMLELYAAEFHRALGQLRKKQEWGVKMYFCSPPLPVGAGKGPLSGKEYLLIRRAQHRREAEAREAIGRRSQASFKDLARYADRIQLKPVAPTAEPGGRQLVWDAVCLLTRPRLEAFERRVGRLEKELEAAGLHFELSGPWPPYHFVAEALGNVPLH